MLGQIVQFLVDTVAGFFVFMLLLRFHFQWLRVPFRNQLGDFIVLLTNWLVLPARRVIPPVAGFDAATWTATWLLQALTLYVVLELRGFEFGAAPGNAIAVIAGLALLDLLRFSLYILIFAVIVQVVLSWVNPHSPVGPLFDAVARPFLRPIRRLVPPIANIDLSALVLLIVLQVLLIPLAHLRASVGGMF